MPVLGRKQPILSVDVNLGPDLRDFDADGLWDAGDKPGVRDGGLADALQLVQLGRDDLRLRRRHRVRQCELRII